MDSLFFLLNRVEQGEEVITKRRGKKVARLISPQKKESLPSMKNFRASIKAAGKPLSYPPFCALPD
jgi:antitoxin (DNA-binding transcriptional repressor) of toxin-antitoxin stability system